MRKGSGEVILVISEFLLENEQKNLFKQVKRAFNAYTI